MTRTPVFTINFIFFIKICEKFIFKYLLIWITYISLSSNELNKKKTYKKLRQKIISITEIYGLLCLLLKDYKIRSEFFKPVFISLIKKGRKDI